MNAMLTYMWLMLSIFTLSMHRVMAQCLGFHWPVVKGKRAPTSEAPVLVAAPHINFVEPVLLIGHAGVGV